MNHVIIILAFLCLASCQLHAEQKIVRTHTTSKTVGEKDADVVFSDFKDDRDDNSLDGLDTLDPSKIVTATGPFRESLFPEGVARQMLKKAERDSGVTVLIVEKKHLFSKETIMKVSGTPIQIKAFVKSLRNSASEYQKK